jgi:hypothetical protein
MQINMAGKDAALFVWRCGNANQEAWGDTPPPASEPVLELTLQRSAVRFKAEGIRACDAHPKHEAAMAAPLPASLLILRLDGCRIRRFPVLPIGIHEFYAAACDFFSLPDLSAYQNLIAIEMPDNRLETLNNPLPPTLARLNLNGNALREIQCSKPATLTSIDIGSNPGIRNTLEHEALVLQADTQRAAAGVPLPVRTSAIVGWILPYAQFPMRRVAVVAAAVVNAKEVNPYKNDHNVHDSGIQESTKANLTYIANYKPDVPPFANLLGEIHRELSNDLPWMLRWWPICNRVGNAGIITTELALRLNQSYVMHGFMPAEIVDRLWLRIMDFTGETRKEVLKRFVDEVLEAKDHCTNGFMVRMANVLIGYDDNVCMKMRPAQIMQARVPASLARLRKAASLTDEQPAPWTLWRDAILQTWTDMEEIDMLAKDRDTWLQGLVDNILDELVKDMTRQDRVAGALDQKIADRIEVAGLNKPAKPVGDLEQPPLGQYIRIMMEAELRALRI